jgi:hypothetical protein
MSLKSIKFFILALLMAMVSACGKSNDQEVKDAILSANILLSTRQCQSAIDLLEGIGRQTRNAYYLKALSSAYACRAGYSTTTFFGSDIAKTATPAPLGGMTTYSTSTVTVTAPLTDDLNFRDLQTAIDILLYAGGIATTIEPTSATRARFFSENQAADINTQLVFMMLVQAGKMLKVYGNADASGVKGGALAGNNCFTDYSNADADVKLAIPALPGACRVTTGSSHAQLDPALLTVAKRRKRLCEGIVLVNGIFELLPSVIASAGGGDLDAINGMTADINVAKDALTVLFPAIGTVATVLSQENCETDSAITTETLESYYAIIFETLIN